MSKPLIQIDNLVREMTDEEASEHEAMVSSHPTLNLETTQE
jgi:hypothetical protein